MENETKKALRPRPEVTALPPYNAGMTASLARKISGRQDVAALASNENPYGSAPAVQEALRAVCPSRYSDSASGGLRSALSEHLGIPVEQIVCGNGSEELIAAVSRAYLSKGDVALTIAPSFGLHEIEPLAAGAKVVKVPMTADMNYDIPALETALASAPKVVFLSSPSNPVGRALTGSQLDCLIAALRPDTLFVFDEAYFEMIDPGYPDGLRMLSRHADKNWVVLRTFSKAYGLAGLRVGYGVASDTEIARSIRACLTPFDVNAAAQAAAVAALSDEDWMQDATQKLRDSRESLARRLHAMNITVIPSQTNFLFLDLGREAGPVAKDLLQRGVIVKAWAEANYTRFLRVSIGLPEENERFAQELGRILDRA